MASAVCASEIAGQPLHALVNNAAISPKPGNGGRLSTLNTEIDLWRTVFNVNFFAPIVLARGLIDELRAGRGSIVNVTSIAGGQVHPFAGSAYSTSKAALASLTREMAADLGPLGIRVNAIAPGEIETSMIGPEYRDIAKGIPMRRLGTAEEVAKKDDLFPLHRAIELRERRRDPHQRRSARLTSERKLPCAASCRINRSSSRNSSSMPTSITATPKSCPGRWPATSIATTTGHATGAPGSWPMRWRGSASAWATASRPWPGTATAISRPTMRYRESAPSCTRSIRACSPSKSLTSPITRKTRCCCST